MVYHLARNKKSNVMQYTIVVLIVIFLFALISITAKEVIDELNDDIQADADFDADAKAQVSDLQSRYPGLMDGGFVMVFLLIWSVGIVVALMVRSHPVMYIFMIILFTFMIFVSAELANSYDDMVTGDVTFTTVPTDFPMMHHLLTHLVTYIIVMGFTIILTMYAKGRYG